MTEKIRLSPAEAEIYALLPKDGERVTSRDLVERLYKKKPPTNARQIVNIHLHALRKKGLIGMSKRKGPIPIEVWR